MNKTLVLTENFPPVEGGSGRWFWESFRSEYPTQFQAEIDRLLAEGSDASAATESKRGALQ